MTAMTWTDALPWREPADAETIGRRYTAAGLHPDTIEAVLSVAGRDGEDYASRWTTEFGLVTTTHLLADLDAVRRQQLAAVAAVAAAETAAKPAAASDTAGMAQLVPGTWAEHSTAPLPA